MKEVSPKSAVLIFQEPRAITTSNRVFVISFLCRAILISALMILMQFQLCFATEKASIVWLADGVSISSLKQIELYPVSLNIEEKQGDELPLTISNTIREELESLGVKVTDITANTAPENFALKINLVHYQPGDVGGRWVGFGGGSAICILRVMIIAGPTGEVVGEIIVANQVSGGGLFSIGAEKSVTKRVAKQVSEELANLLGAESDTAKEEIK